MPASRIRESGEARWVLVLPVLALGFVGFLCFLSTPDREAPAAGAAAPGPERTAPSRSAPAATRRETSRSRTPPPRSRREIFSDLRRALREGGDSDLIHLKTSSERELFQSWAATTRSRGRKAGVTLFRDGDGSSRTQRFRISLDGSRMDGTIELRRISDRWCVVSARPAAQR